MGLSAESINKDLKTLLARTLGGEENLDSLVGNMKSAEPAKTQKPAVDQTPALSPLNNQRGVIV